MLLHHLAARDVSTAHSRVLFERDADSPRTRRLLGPGEGGFGEGTGSDDQPGRTATI